MINLQELIKNGIMTDEDLRDLESVIEVKKKKRILDNWEHDIWQGSNGYWYTYAYVNGKRKMIKKRHKEDLEEFIIQAEENPTIEELFDMWIKYKEEHDRLVDSSLMRYTNVFHHLIKNSPFAKKRIRELTEDDIYTFIQTILMDKDLSTKEYGNVKTVLQGMIRYARFEKKYTSINISNFFGDFRVGKNILKKSEKTDAQKCFTDEERIRILELVDKKPDIRNLAIHLCFQTGVRIGELAALKWEDIDWENGTLHIQRIETRAFTQDTSTTQKKSYITVKERTKTESSNRYIDLTDLTLETLRQIKELNPDGEYLFEEKHRRINAHSFRKRLYDLCAQANIERKSPHCVRRYEASKMLSNGVDESTIKNQHGHTDIKTTKGYYQFDIQQKAERKKQIEQAINY